MGGRAWPAGLFCGWLRNVRAGLLAPTWRRRLGLALVVGVAAGLRIWLLAAGWPLHHDEALYGSWAQLIAGGRDPFLLTAWVDKPPLVLYIAAAALRLGGVSEQALRVPGVIASLATLTAVYGLARRLYGDDTALLASALWACAPFAILFAPTIFTDPWLTLWLVVAVWAAVAGRSCWAGIALGLAVASKQQGALAAPLAATLLLAGPAPADCKAGCNRPLGAAWARFGLGLAGFLLVFLPVVYWDSLRWSNRPSFWDRSLTTYGGLGVTPVALWPARAADWGRIAAYLFGAAAPTGLMLGLAGLAAWRDGRRRFAVKALSLFVVGYVALHVGGAFQPWDRYLLPLLPFVCILAARGAALIWREALWPAAPPLWRIAVRGAVSGGLALILAWGAWLGAGARLPVGSDHGAYVGFDRVAAFLRSQDAHAVIYQRWLGWHFDFYLFDAPQERRWWGAGWKLADDAAQTAHGDPGREQWVVLPGWRDAAAGEARLALASRGLTLAEALRVYRGDGSRAFTVYRIVPDSLGEAWPRG